MRKINQDNTPKSTTTNARLFAHLPPGIPKACGLIFVYALVVTLNAVFVAIQNHKFAGVSLAILLVLWTLRLTANLAAKKKWAWMFAVVGGIVLQARYLMGIAVWFLRHGQGLHPQPQLLAYYAICILILAFAVPPLLKQESRSAFNISRHNSVAETTIQPPIPEP